MYDELLALLLALDGVSQDRRYHPEGDALYHSLQVFECAWKQTDDGELLAAALLHDVGKAVDCRQHAEVGADLLDGLVPPRVLWLVTHHLDLLRQPALTRQRLHRTRQLADLERLRSWDLFGRRRGVWVPGPEDALACLMNAMEQSRLRLDATDDHAEAV